MKRVAFLLVEHGGMLDWRVFICLVGGSIAKLLVFNPIIYFGF